MIGDSIVSSPEDGLDKLAKHARGVLVVLALLEFASAAFLWIAAGVDSPVVLGSHALVGLVFTGLAVWARRNPLPPVVIGLVIWSLGLLATAAIAPWSLFQGILVKGLIIVAFVNGIQTGLTYNRLKRDLTPGQ